MFNGTWHCKYRIIINTILIGVILTIISDWLIPFKVSFIVIVEYTVFTFTLL